MSEDLHEVRLSVNGVTHEVRVPARRLLSDALRHDLGLTGTHVAASIQLDGRGSRRFGRAVAHVLQPALLDISIGGRHRAADHEQGDQEEAEDQRDRRAAIVSCCRPHGTARKSSTCTVNFPTVVTPRPCNNDGTPGTATSRVTHTVNCAPG